MLDWVIDYFIKGLHLALRSGFTALIQDVDGWGEGFWSQALHHISMRGAKFNLRR